MTDQRRFDPVAFKEMTRAQWQQTAAAWYRWSPTLAAGLEPVTLLMLDLAQLGPGDRVLDVGAGTGEPALSAVERVGTTGFVLATDISANILTFATQEAQARGLGATRFQTRVMDAEALELDDASFDCNLYTVRARVIRSLAPDDGRSTGGRAGSGVGGSRRRPAPV